MLGSTEISEKALWKFSNKIFTPDFKDLLLLFYYSSFKLDGECWGCSGLPREALSDFNQGSDWATQKHRQSCFETTPFVILAVCLTSLRTSSPFLGCEKSREGFCPGHQRIWLHSPFPSIATHLQLKKKQTLQYHETTTMHHCRVDICR